MLKSNRKKTVENQPRKLKQNRKAARSTVRAPRGRRASARSGTVRGGTGQESPGTPDKATPSTLNRKPCFKQKKKLNP